MARYGASAKKAVHKTEEGTQNSGKAGKAKTKKQAIAIGLSEAREKGAKVPAKKKCQTWPARGSISAPEPNRR